MALPAFRVAQVANGGSPQTAHYTVKAGETFSRGDQVTLDTLGVILASVDDVAVLLGFAGADADPGEDIPVQLATPGTIFSAYNSGTAYAAAARGDLASGNITTQHSVVVGTAGNGAYKVEGEDTTDSDRVLVSVVDAASQAPGGSAAPLTAT